MVESPFVFNVSLRKRAALVFAAFTSSFFPVTPAVVYWEETLRVLTPMTLCVQYGAYEYRVIVVVRLGSGREHGLEWLNKRRRGAGEPCCP